MSLLETIISVAQKKWEEKPRHDLVSSFVALRMRMVECKRFYDEYQEICDQGRYEEWLKVSKERSERVGTRFADPRQSWVWSISLLCYSILELASVLKIFGGDTSSRIFDFANLEEAIEAAMARKQGNFLDLNRLKSLSGQSLDFDLDEYKLEPTFTSALRELDAFIKTNFKMEEVYAAEKRLRGNDDISPDAISVGGSDL